MVPPGRRKERGEKWNQRVEEKGQERMAKVVDLNEWS